MKHKLLSVLLALAMALTMLPASALAAGTGVGAENVAKIGETGYATIAAALTQASTTETTIELLRDTNEDVTIAGGKNITLNIPNGVTLTNASGHTITVESGATLTVTGEGTVDNITHQRGALLNNGGTVILNGCTFTRSRETGESATSGGTNSWYTIRNQGAGKLTIGNGTKVTQNGKFSSLICSYCEGEKDVPLEGVVTITGGEFDGGLNTVVNKNGSTLNISGGTFKNTAQFVILNDNVCTISNGTFTYDGTASNAAIGNRYGAGTNSAGTMTISGGTFTATNGLAVSSWKGGENPSGTNGKLTITGGTFSSNPFANGTGVTSDTHVATETSGKWVVGLKPAEPATINLTGSTVKQLSGTLNPVDVEGAETMNVTVKPSGELQWSPYQAASGGTNERAAGWYVGIQIVAPTAITSANIANAKYANSANKVVRSFEASKDGQLDSTGNYFLNAWGGISEAKLEAMKANGEKTTALTWKFDWNGDHLGDVNSTVSDFDTWTADQTFTLTIDLSDPNLKLLDKDGNQVWPEPEKTEAGATATVTPDQDGTASVTDISDAISKVDVPDGSTLDQVTVNNVTINATTTSSDPSDPPATQATVTLGADVVSTIKTEKEATSADSTTGTAAAPAIKIEETTIKTDVVDVTLPTDAFDKIDSANASNKIEDNGLTLAVEDTTDENDTTVQKVINVTLKANDAELTVAELPTPIKLVVTLDSVSGDLVVYRDNSPMTKLDNAENTAKAEGFYIDTTNGTVTIWTKHLSEFKIGTAAPKITATYNKYTESDSEHAAWGSGKLEFAHLKSNTYYVFQCKAVAGRVYQMFKSEGDGTAKLHVQGNNILEEFTLAEIGSDYTDFYNQMKTGVKPFVNVTLASGKTITQN